MFNINLPDILPHAIDAYCNVYGNEYRELISSKINKSIILQYIDVNGYDDYIEYVKRCKRRELSYEFLIKSRLIFEKYDNFSNKFNEDVRNILDCFIGNEHTVFDKKLSYYFAPIFSFDKNNPIDSDKLMENKLKIINFIKNNDTPITKYNYDDFVKTIEFDKIIKKINIYKNIYKNLLDKYNEFEKQLEPYKNFIKNEKDTFNEIMYGKRIEFFNDIFPLLNDEIIFLLKSKKITTQENIIVGNRDLSEKSPLEFFCEEDLNILKSNEFSMDEKYWIILFQSNYLKSLGICVPNYLLNCMNNDEVNSYLNFLNSENIKKFIPSQELITKICHIRNVKYNESIAEYYTQREDFMYNINYFIDNEYNRKFLLNQILNNDICVLSCGGSSLNNDFISLMFFTIKKNHAGKLLHCFLHELGHIINQSELGCGFESSNHLYNHNERNKYDNSLRKYERFNEILTDIFTMETTDFLYNKNMYLIENKSLLSDDVKNFNTSSYLKTLLFPLVDKYREFVCKSMIYSDPNYLIEAIGLHNFESLIDSLNKIDYMIKNGLFNNENDNYLAEYYSEIDNIEKTYLEIDIYYHSVKQLLKKHL